LGLVAEYGVEECLIAFRGSKKFVNWLLDFNFAWKEPYPTCEGCKVHDGFYSSWQSLKSETLDDLHTMGCDKKPIRIIGHSLGGAMAALAAFDLMENYQIKHVYTYGQPRVSNQAWVDAFEQKVAKAKVPYFRVVDYMDVVPHLPPSYLPKEVDQFRHPGPEVFYTATKMGSYRVCPTGEDPTCSNQYQWEQCLSHICCHCSYLGLNPCDINNATPQCIQPTAAGNAIGFDWSGSEQSIVV
jgi:hypothetical protein